MTSDLHHLAAAYSLDALDEHERREFEAHYPSCAICSQEVIDFRETAGALAESVEDSPPAELKAQIMSEIGRTRQLPPVVTPLSAARATRPQWLLAAVAAAVLLIAGTFVVVNRDTTDRVSDVVAAPDAVVTTLEGDQGSLQVVWSASLGQVALIGNDMVQPAGDHALALWSLLEDGVAPAGLFVPDGGSVRTVLEVADAGPTGWGVTVEPSSGSPQPTSDIIYLGTI